ncbi:hypothetical protein IC006_0460 [Sulfuracidifex tepidarius]|uniref:Uncharacterized protein n=1 Tax=Sulfuracidifex tepidarius TaxID=1294262 RepID=A0A510DSK6_9CREN|nr:hypothetical protein IC006_0460 [Sulfuracidifex tepidarius]BBG25925.1 hypothetical protein IC007_0430 [Sulfuracidifex tepidarius]
MAKGTIFLLRAKKEDAEICLNVTKEIINLVRKIWGEKWCSEQKE